MSRRSFFRVETRESLSPAERALGLPESGWMHVGGPLHYREWEGPTGLVTVANAWHAAAEHAN